VGEEKNGGRRRKAKTQKPGTQTRKKVPGNERKRNSGEGTVKARMGKKHGKKPSRSRPEKQEQPGGHAKKKERCLTARKVRCNHWGGGGNNPVRKLKNQRKKKKNNIKQIKNVPTKNKNGWVSKGKGETNKGKKRKEWKTRRAKRPSVGTARRNSYESKGKKKRGKKLEQTSWESTWKGSR